LAGCQAQILILKILNVFLWLIPLKAGRLLPLKVRDLRLELESRFSGKHFSKVSLLDEMTGHPSMARYRDDGYEIVSF
jgi:hypothetical protein